MLEDTPGRKQHTKDNARCAGAVMSGDDMVNFEILGYFASITCLLSYQYK